MTHLRRFRVEKLIRDRLPAMMRADGLTVFDRRLDDQEFVARLRDKLVEEAREAAASETRAELVQELADLAEVIAALSSAAGVSAAEIEQARVEKHAERGGFGERVFNAAVEAPDGTPAIAYYLARPEQYPEIE